MIFPVDCYLAMHGIGEVKPDKVTLPRGHYGKITKYVRTPSSVRKAPHALGALKVPEIRLKDNSALSVKRSQVMVSKRSSFISNLQVKAI